MGLVLWQMLNIVARPGYRGIPNHRYILGVRVDGLGSQSGVWGVGVAWSGEISWKYHFGGQVRTGKAHVSRT